MPVRYGKFTMPERIIVEEESAASHFIRCVVAPLEPGFGHVVGNGLRRTSLMALEAPAIISIAIEGILHEYMAVEGIVEDMVAIVLNIKGALLRKLPIDDNPHSRDSRILSSVVEVTQADLDKHKGKVVVTLGSLVPQGTFEVINPDLPIFTVTKPMRKQVDLRVAFGRGYVPSERQKIADRVSHEIIIDAIHSPVRLANYYVENTRVGHDTEFDKLILELQTDGRLTPREALSFAVQIVMLHFQVFDTFQPMALSFDEADHSSFADRDELLDKLLLGIDEVELSVRSANCLRGANIETLAELVSIPERRMLDFRNFGKKSLSEIKDKLHEMGLHLGMDLRVFDISSENVKERVKQYREERGHKKEILKQEEAK